jgi:hypothetical protein
MVEPDTAAKLALGIPAAGPADSGWLGSPHHSMYSGENMTGVFVYSSDADRQRAEAAVGMCLGTLNASPYDGHAPRTLICCGSGLFRDRLELTFRRAGKGTPVNRPSSDWSRLPPLQFDVKV